VTTPSESVQPTDQRSTFDDVAEHLAAGGETPTIDLEPFLPPAGDPTRLLWLHDLVGRALQISWQRGRPRMLAEYVKRFPELGAERDLPVALIFAEYRARLLAGGLPTLDEYRRRFPEQFPELVRMVAAGADTANELTGTLCAPASQQAPSSASLVQPLKSSPSTAHMSFQGDPQPLSPSVHHGSAPSTAAAVGSIQQTFAGAPLPNNDSSMSSLAVAQVLPVSEGFKLFKRIGRGAFGEVFLAEAPGGVNVAVKRIFRPLDDESSQRELQSLQLIRELRHPYLLQTQAFWSLEDRLVIVMELADDSLADWNQQVRTATGEGVPVAELLAYFGEAAEALDYLHRMNVLHRDVKPANLLRLKGHAKVADFGLARMMEAKLEASTFCGTPLYMAPEVWKKKLCPQSDQYSLAITYAELRMGRQVFSGADFMEVCRKHTSDKPDLDPLPEGEQRILSRALAKDPELRYPDCVSFIDALRSEFAAPPVATPRGRSWIGAALAVGVLAVLSALYVVVWTFMRPPASVAVVPAPARAPLLPAGCQPDGTDLDGRYYTRIVHPLPNAAPIVLLLIPQNKSGEPAPFYVMRDKVSNGQFNAAVQDSGMAELLAEAAKAGPWAVRRQWNKEGRGDPGQAALPVVYVTLPEARCFAQFLGGDLPTITQWDKAAGRFDSAEGPFAIGKPPKGLAAVKNQGREIPRPFPAGDPDGDESVFGCRDMADNGREWTCTTPRGDLINLAGKIEASDQCHLRGGTFLGDDVFRFADLKHQGQLSVQDPRNDVGFRVVVEAPRE
jgi:Protein kinase domain/Sulfatase-modifying factor enzyme 1